MKNFVLWEDNEPVGDKEWLSYGFKVVYLISV